MNYDHILKMFIDIHPFIIAFSQIYTYIHLRFIKNTNIHTIKYQQIIYIKALMIYINTAHKITLVFQNLTHNSYSTLIWYHVHVQSTILTAAQPSGIPLHNYFVTTLKYHWSTTRVPLRYHYVAWDSGVAEQESFSLSCQNRSSLILK